MRRVASVGEGTSPAAGSAPEASRAGGPDPLAASVELTRRALLARMGLGLAALTVTTACGPLSPRQARARRLALHRLGAEEGATLEAFADVLLPGTREAGIAHYVDDQLGREVPLLFLKYMDWPGPYVEFYRSGLESLERLCRDRHGVAFEQTTAAQSRALVAELAKANPTGWSGPPAPLFYFVLRNDAIDVYYGTQEGFEKLAVPYMPHILPPQSW